MIRFLEEKDIPGIMPLSKRCYDEMNFDSLGYLFDPVQVEKSYRIGIEGKLGICIVNKADVIDGIMACSVSDQTWYFTGMKIAIEIIWHVDPLKASAYRLKTMLKMKDFMEVVLANRGIKSLYIAVDARYPVPGKALAHSGYKPVSTFYFKELGELCLGEV